MKILRRNKTDIPKKYIYIIALLFMVTVIMQINSTEQITNTGFFIRRIVLFSSIYFLWALLLDYINALVKSFEKERSVLIQVIERLVSLVLLVLFNLVITNVIYYVVPLIFKSMTVTDVYLDFQPYILKSIIIRCIDVIIIGFILKVVYGYQSLQKQKLQVVSLENQLHISQLETLRNQLDPHFLFNTLHTLNTLIGYDDKKARSMVIKITNLLRKILDKRDRQLITFDEEIDYFKNYLEIEEERFHDRLEIQINVEDVTREIMVPTLILQPLIENAFKHGIGQLEGKGTIKLKAFRKDNNFIISLSNTINNKSNVSISTKFGLKNLDMRLQQVYGDNYILDTKEGIEDYIAIITIKNIN
ncbi:sensor histidine kinase [uncultured Psychroserpens sp.]|uniref:sensor histidine kinase n=1 Tax=uncultured Psychroserpens sp. TaxID=255436 RepID=UPI002627C668|nr:histidine kinase [uncultured Psychroserpens sp.]